MELECLITSLLEEEVNRDETPVYYTVMVIDPTIGPRPGLGVNPA
jgi:hypothetical protein